MDAAAEVQEIIKPGAYEAISPAALNIAVTAAASQEIRSEAAVSRHENVQVIVLELPREGRTNAESAHRFGFFKSQIGTIETSDGVALIPVSEEAAAALTLKLSTDKLDELGKLAEDLQIPFQLVLAARFARENRFTLCSWPEAISGDPASGLAAVTDLAKTWSVQRLQREILLVVQAGSAFQDSGIAALHESFTRVQRLGRYLYQSVDYVSVNRGRPFSALDD